MAWKVIFKSIDDNIKKYGEKVCKCKTIISRLFNTIPELRR
jgi:hypothetical protein